MAKPRVEALVDYKELYSPVVRYETIRSILAISAKEHLSLFQFDVATAFLAAELEDVELFMKQPEGFDDGTGRVCALRKAIYGAAQASRAFNKEINKTLLGMRLVKLKQSSADPCLYISDPPNRVFALIFVDDGLLATTNDRLAMDFINERGKTFELTSRPLDFFLGIHINISKDKGRIQINQSRYINELLERFQMVDSKPSPVPIDPTSKSAYEGEVDISLQYRELVGALNYASLGTRLDISFAVGFLSRYLDKPTKHLWNTALKTLRYLKSTKYYGPVYTGKSSDELIAYSDADWSGCTSSRRSTSGAFIQFGGAAIGWCSKRQASVTLSSLESELVASCEAAKYCIWLKRLFHETGYKVRPKVLIDNTACISSIKNHQISRRSKHIEVRFFFVREKAESGEFTVHHVGTEDNISDIFTKILNRIRFQKLRSLAGIVNEDPAVSHANAGSR